MLKYLPNPMLFSSVFVLPAAIADEHLKLASAAALKVILTLFRCQNEAFDLQKIADRTGLAVGEVADACAYWADKGVLLVNGTTPSVPTQEISTVAAQQTAGENEDITTLYVAESETADPVCEVVHITADDFADLQTEDENAPLQDIVLDPLVQKTSVEPDAVTELNNNATVSMIREESEKEKVEASRNTREKITVSPSRPTHAQICARLDESAELRELFNEAQTVLGRMLGTGDQAALLLLYDYYGLPADVLLMLCEYARTMGKAGNLNYIYAVGQDWSEREIDTFERADEELRRLAQVDTDWTQFCALTGLQHLKPTKGQQKYIHSWTTEWKFTVPMLALAFEKMKERTDGVRFSYMNGILKNWFAKGITTPEQVEKEELDFKEKSQPDKIRTAKKPSEPKANGSEGVSAAVAKSGIAGGEASYDLDKAEQAARNTVPTLKKRKKN